MINKMIETKRITEKSKRQKHEGQRISSQQKKMITWKKYRDNIPRAEGHLISNTSDQITIPIGQPSIKYYFRSLDCSVVVFEIIHYEAGVKRPQWYYAIGGVVTPLRFKNREVGTNIKVDFDGATIIHTTIHCQLRFDNGSRYDLSSSIPDMELIEQAIVPIAESSSMGPTVSHSGIQLNSRDITSMAGRGGYIGEHDISDGTIKELGWDLTRIVERPTLVTTFQWDTSSTGVLYTGAVPGSLQSMAFAKIPFQSFLYWRGDVVLNLQVAGSPMVQGILAMTFLPLMSYSELQTIIWDYSSLSINPTVYLFANANTNAQLRIPFNHPQAYLNTTFSESPESYGADISNNLGFVVIYVLESFKTAGTLSGVTVSLFSHLEDSEFKVPQLSSTIESNFRRSLNINNDGSIRVPRAESNFIASGISMLADAAGPMLEPVMEHLGSSLKSYVDRDTGSTPENLISSMASKALPSNFLGDVLDQAGPMLDGVLGLLGMDNPTLPTETGRTVVKGNGNLNAAIGPEFIEKLAIDSSGLSLVTGETFATVTDEMDTEYLYRKYSYVGRFDITTSDSVGSLLWSIPLSPFPTLGGTTPLVPIGTIVQDTVWFPLLSYLGLPYRYWTGGLRYKFIVSASMMHTCKIFVAFNYGTTTVPTSLLDAASQYGTSIEIAQGSNEFEFSVPYVALRPYLDVSRGVNNLTNSMGMLHVIVQNELIAPESVAQDISVAVFLCGSTDFSYEYLADYNPAYPVYDNTLTGMNTKNLNLAERDIYESANLTKYHHRQGRTPRAESALYTQTATPTNNSSTVIDLAQGDLDQDEDVQIAPPQRETQVDDHFGVTGLNLRMLGKKYQLIGYSQTMSIVPDQQKSNIVHFAIKLSDIFKTPGFTIQTPLLSKLPNATPNGVLTWMAAMYKQFKGGIRLKIVFNTSETNNTTTVSSPFVGAAAYYFPGPAPAELIPDTDVLTTIPQNSWILLANNIHIMGRSTPRLGCLAASTSNVLEFELPYSSPYLSALVRVDSADQSLYNYDLGYVIVTCNVRQSSVIEAVLYAALADESRFGTLYRVPQTYVPCNFNLVSQVVTPVSNVAWGTYLVPTTEVPRAESGLNMRNASQLDISDPDVAELMAKLKAQDPVPDIVEKADQSIPTTGVSSSTPANKHAYKKKHYKAAKNPVAYIHRKIRQVVVQNPTMNDGDMLAYIRSITPTGWARADIGTMEQMLRSAGVTKGKQGNFVLRPPRPSRFNTNRRRIMRQPNVARSSRKGGTNNNNITARPPRE